LPHTHLNEKDRERANGRDRSAVVAFGWTWGSSGDSSRTRAKSRCSGSFHSLPENSHVVDVSRSKDPSVGVCSILICWWVSISGPVNSQSFLNRLTRMCHDLSVSEIAWPNSSRSLFFFFFFWHLEKNGANRFCTPNPVVRFLICFLVTKRPSRPYHQISHSRCPSFPVVRRKPGQSPCCFGLFLKLIDFQPQRGIKIWKLSLGVREWNIMSRPVARPAKERNFALWQMRDWFCLHDRGSEECQIETEDFSADYHLPQRQDFHVYLCFTQYVSGASFLIPPHAPTPPPRPTELKFASWHRSSESGQKGNRSLNLKSQTTTDLDILKMMKFWEKKNKSKPKITKTVWQQYC
jgi:hypothetical protein